MSGRGWKGKHCVCSAAKAHTSLTGPSLLKDDECFIITTSLVTILKRHKNQLQKGSFYLVFTKPDSQQKAMVSSLSLIIFPNWLFRPKEITFSYWLTYSSFSVHQLKIYLFCIHQYMPYILSSQITTAYKHPWNSAIFPKMLSSVDIWGKKSQKNKVFMWISPVLLVIMLASWQNIQMSICMSNSWNSWFQKSSWQS